jgi:hypothetical protein
MPIQWYALVSLGSYRIMRLARSGCGCLLTICDGLVPRVGTKMGTVPRPLFPLLDILPARRIKFRQTVV